MSPPETPAVDRVAAEPVTSAGFAPYGDVLSVDASERRSVDIYGSRVNVHTPSSFESDRPVEFIVSESNVRPFEVRYLERHGEITQSFVPLGDPFVLVVAAPDAPLENGVPGVEEMAAFLVPGDTGVNMHRGTWHEVPFPLSDGARRVTTSHRALTRGLESERDERGEIDAMDVEKRNVRERLDRRVRVDLP